MDVYVYCADIYCEDCGLAIKAELKKTDDTGDSGDYPQGPYSDGGGESDCPQHCGDCHTFLENPLTSDGYDYVREAAAGGGICVKTWLDYYDID